MERIIVNAMGERCPIPIVKATKALLEMKEPGTLEVHVDNSTAVQNLTRMASGNKLEAKAEKVGSREVWAPSHFPASVWQLPCRSSTGRFFATFFPSSSFLSPTPSGSDRDGEARPSGAVGRPGREMGLDSDSAWEA